MGTGGWDETGEVGRAGLCSIGQGMVGGLDGKPSKQFALEV